MDDERVIGRPAFRRKDPRYRFGVRSVGSESVDGFRGNCDESTLEENSYRRFEVCFVVRTEELCCHGVPVTFDQGFWLREIS